MTTHIDLNFAFPDDDGETLALTTRVWSIPEIPTLRHKPPRLKDAPAWTPFRSLMLVRTTDPFTGTYDCGLGSAEAGSRIDFHLGCVSEQPLSETRRLVKAGARYITLAEHERLTPAMRSLGFIGTVPFPMLDALEVRRLSDGQEVLAAGEADLLREKSESLGTLGFIEPFPLRPRLAPGAIGRALRPLWRWFDPEVDLHRYGCPSSVPLGAVCLGSVQAVLDPFGLGSRHGEEAFAPLRLDVAQNTGASRIVGRARWTVAPMLWRNFGGRDRLDGALERVRAPIVSGRREHSGSAPIGYLRSRPAPHHSPLYAAVHPITRDLFLTRSAIEAGDMGYRNVHPLGWIADSGADRRPGRDRIWWASRFGQLRRYHEGAERQSQVESAAPTPDGHGRRSTALLEARSAAGLATLGVTPGETRAVISSGSSRALAVAVTPPDTSLLAIVADSHRRCAERCGADYVVVSLLPADEGDGRLAELERRYERLCLLEPDILVGRDADPFSYPDRDVIRGDRAQPFAERRRRLLELVVDLPEEDAELTENRR